MDEALRRRASAGLYDFVRQAWPVVEMQRPFTEAWHIGAICEHLEAVASGQITNLGINVPPSTGKSTVASVMFPAWVWARDPTQRFLCASYDQTQSTRDNMRMRDLVLSEWFQRWWPTTLRDDLNLKTKYANTKGGWRIGVAVSAPRIGEHPNYKLIDDPHNPRKQLMSDAEIMAASDWYDFNMKVRGQMIGARTVLIMQRLHQRDLTGYLRERGGSEWEWLVLPMRWEPRAQVRLSTGWRDPREGHPGALLWPTEWTEQRVNDTYRPGTWGDAGQFQQRPAPSGGLLFKRDWIKVVDTVPGEVVATVRSWDVAGTTETQRTHSTARTAGVRMSRTTTGAFVITDIVKGWWSDHEVDAAMRQAAQLDGPEVEVREEQEPGSSGLAVVNARRKALAGYPYRGVRPMTDKVTRARPMASQAEGGHVMILVPQADGVPDARAQTMAKEFLDELEMFPAGTLKDQVDAASQALNVLTGVAEPLEITRGPQAAPQTPEEMQAEEARRSAEARQAVDDAIARDGVYWP